MLFDETDIIELFPRFRAGTAEVAEALRERLKERGGCDISLTEETGEESAWLVQMKLEVSRSLEQQQLQYDALKAIAEELKVQFLGWRHSGRTHPVI